MTPLFRCTCEGCPRNTDELEPHPHNPRYVCWPCWAANRDKTPHLHSYRAIAQSIAEIEAGYEYRGADW
jgi:hypothetical protein